MRLKNIRFKSIMPLFVLLGVVLGVLPVLRSQTAHSITVAWTAPTSGGAVATYNVKRSTSTGTEVTIATVPASQTSFVDTTGTAGTTYFYVISASNQFGESPNSSEVSGLFLGDKPGAPQGPTAVSR